MSKSRPRSLLASTLRNQCNVSTIKIFSSISTLYKLCILFEIDNLIKNCRCTNVPGGYECSCAPGCMGDPDRGCVCDGELVNLCRDHPCGLNAQCRMTPGDIPQCYCPVNFPSGDPYVQCKFVQCYLAGNVNKLLNFIFKYNL